MSDVQWHEDGTCYVECPYSEKDAMKIPFIWTHINLRRCSKFNIPVAQSIHYCPAYVTEIEDKLTQWRGTILKERPKCEQP